MLDDLRRRSDDVVGDVASGMGTGVDDSSLGRLASLVGEGECEDCLRFREGGESVVGRGESSGTTTALASMFVSV